MKEGGTRVSPKESSNGIPRYVEDPQGFLNHGHEFAENFSFVGDNVISIIRHINWNAARHKEHGETAPMEALKDLKFHILSQVAKIWLKRANGINVSEIEEEVDGEIKPRYTFSIRRKNNTWYKTDTDVERFDTTLNSQIQQKLLNSKAQMNRVTIDEHKHKSKPAEAPQLDEKTEEFILSTLVLRFSSFPTGEQGVELMKDFLRQINFKRSQQKLVGTVKRVKDRHIVTICNKILEDNELSKKNRSYWEAIKQAAVEVHNNSTN